MSEWYEDNDDNNGASESNAMRVLREKAEADSKLIREMSEELKEYRRERELDKLTGVAKSKGLDPSVVALATKAGYEANEQGLDGFLKDFGGLITKPAEGSETEGEQPLGDETTVSAEEQAALGTMAAASQSATPAKGIAALEAQIMGATDEEALLKILQSNG